MRATRTIGTVLLTMTLLIFAACANPLSLPNKPESALGSKQEARTSNTNLEVMTLKDKIIPWEIVLKSVAWNGAKVTVALTITNKGSEPADFPYDALGGGRVVNFLAIDSYGVQYTPQGNTQFNVEGIYPGETRTFKPTFTVNARSGKTSLYVTRYTGAQKVVLFDIGAPK